MENPARMRNVVSFALAAGGCLLLGVAYMDWASYTSFVMSLLWE